MKYAQLYGKSYGILSTGSNTQTNSVCVNTHTDKHTQQLQA